MIVTAHQPNYLPGLSVIEKVEAADAVIWLTEVQYPRGGWTNRNRMPDGSWLTVPVDHATTGGPISAVEISEHGDWRRAHARTLRQHFADVDAICAVIERPYRYLAHMNLDCLRLLADDSGWHYQFDFVGRSETISEQLARMVYLVGGTTYLSGPSGRRYLDERPFEERGIAVVYFERRCPTCGETVRWPDGEPKWSPCCGALMADNPCALSRVRC